MDRIGSTTASCKHLPAYRIQHKFFSCPLPVYACICKHKCCYMTSTPILLSRGCYTRRCRCAQIHVKSTRRLCPTLRLPTECNHPICRCVASPISDSVIVATAETGRLCGNCKRAASHTLVLRTKISQSTPHTSLLILPTLRSHTRASVSSNARSLMCYQISLTALRPPPQSMNLTIIDT